MQPNNNSDSNASIDKQSHGISNPNRRSFLIKGAVAAPILASFINKPVWAIDDSCINSGTLSGNLSNHQCVAIARSSGWWAGADSRFWPTDVGISDNSFFESVIGRKPLKFNKNTFHKVKKGKPELNADGSLALRTKKKKFDTLKDVLSNGTDFDRQLIASYLNIVHSGIFYPRFDNVGTLITDSNQVLNNYLAAAKLSINPGDGKISPESQQLLNQIVNDYALNLTLSNTNTDEG